jgi:hypothetical protein
VLAAACLKRGEQNTKQNKPMAGSIGDTLVWYTVFFVNATNFKGSFVLKEIGQHRCDTFVNYQESWTTD